MKEKPKIFVSCTLFTEAITLFQDDFELVYPASGSNLSNMEQMALLPEVRGAVISVTDKIDKAALSALSLNLKVIATYSVGTNHIDLGEASARGITVLNTPDVLSESCADTTFLLMLGAARRAVEALDLVRSGAWQGWQPDQLLGKDVWSQRLGIFGMGRIGQAVARRARGFGMEVHYYNRRQLPPGEESGAHYHSSLEELMCESDFFCIACPPSVHNTGIIDKARLALLPDGAVLVNISRGEIVQDHALIEALHSGKVAAAGLDVFANEPDINPAYREMKNVFGLPHLGSSTLATRVRMAELLRDGIRSVLITGDPPLNCANP